MSCASLQQLGVGAEQLGKLAEDPERFALGFGDGGAQGVAQLDRGGRLDEEGAGAGRFVVHDAVGARARVAPHRNDVAAVAHRDRRRRSGAAASRPR